MAAPKPELKKWTQTPGSFRRFVTWLDEGTDSGGERYLEMRRRLVAYFDRKRAQSPDELADETLNRVARRLDEEGAITDTPPARYCYIVARFVFLEYARRREHSRSSVDDIAIPVPPEPDATTEERERLLDCLERCLQQLDAADRALILDYYRGEQGVKIEQRRELAARLNITANALSIRACRIRVKLEACVSACSARK
jgi:DNA-directed RNA polymerase specialized sigma24 family protein